jgi:hypothetical protein
MTGHRMEAVKRHNQDVTHLVPTAVLWTARPGPAA